MITSGPWKWVDKYGGRQRRLMGTGSDVPILIASQVKEQDAAALRGVPELLAALRNLSDRVDTMAAAMRRRGLGNWVNEWLGDGIVDDARAAIAGQKGVPRDSETDADTRTTAV